MILILGQISWAQDLDELDLIDQADLNELLDKKSAPESATKGNDVATPGNDSLDLSSMEEIDDLESLKNDIGVDLTEEESLPKEKVGEKRKEIDQIEKEGEQKAMEANLKLKATPEKKEDPKLTQEKKLQDALGEEVAEESKTPEIFDVGAEESKLLELSKYVEGKIPDNEWNEIAANSKMEKYEVQEGDWLWKISKKLFGSGFYYSKIWSLNPQIGNPHEIEPGMVLVFDTGDTLAMPEVTLGEFKQPSVSSLGGEHDGLKKDISGQFDFTQFGAGQEPTWLSERKKLIDQGVYFQYASEATYDDLEALGKKALQTEYEKYSPPVPDIIIEEPGEEYDDSGFDKSSKVRFNFKEGFFLNTFVTSNIVQDLGEIEAIEKESVFIQKFDKVFVRLDNSVKAKPGDQFSVYNASGKVSHQVSDRAGYRYTIVAQIKVLRKINHLWECEVTDLSGILQRKDRITVYTPKIGRITKTFNKRNIEAAVIAATRDTANGLSMGDVVYLDRGRADGVELGNVFELYGFIDKGTERRITPDPAYKIGEVTVITLSDNFSTGLITLTRDIVALGTLALSKSEEQAARAARLKNKEMLKSIKELEGKALDELDVELHLDDVSEDLLKKADKIQLSEDELEELERQERERSVIREHEKDIKELDRLEKEIIDAENALNEAKFDEDKYLEQQNLNNIEQQAKSSDPNAFESLNDIEGEIGLKFMDEDLNSKENPYGLTEFDLEEVDELLNTDQL